MGDTEKLSPEAKASFESNVTKLEEFSKKEYPDGLAEDIHAKNPALYEKIQHLDSQSKEKLDEASKELDAALAEAEKPAEMPIENRKQIDYFKERLHNFQVSDDQFSTMMSQVAKDGLPDRSFYEWSDASDDRRYAEDIQKISGGRQADFISALEEAGLNGTYAKEIETETDYSKTNFSYERMMQLADFIILGVPRCIKFERESAKKEGEEAPEARIIAIKKLNSLNLSDKKWIAMLEDSEMDDKETGHGIRDRDVFKNILMNYPTKDSFVRYLKDNPMYISPHSGTTIDATSIDAKYVLELLNQYYPNGVPPESEVAQATEQAPAVSETVVEDLALAESVKKSEFKKTVEIFYAKDEDDNTTPKFPDDFYAYMMTNHADFVGQANEKIKADPDRATSQDYVKKIEEYYKEFTTPASSGSTETVPTSTTTPDTTTAPAETVPTDTTTPDSPKEPAPMHGDDPNPDVVHDDIVSGPHDETTDGKKEAADTKKTEKEGAGKFTVDLGDKENSTRIEDIVKDFVETPSATSSRYPGKVFYYEDGKFGKSYYSPDGERLKIYNGDVVTLGEKEKPKDGPSDKEKERYKYINEEYGIKRNEGGSYTIDNKKGKDVWDFSPKDLKYLDPSGKLPKAISQEDVIYTFDEKRGGYYNGADKLVINQDNASFRIIRDKEQSQETSEKLSHSQSLARLNDLARWGYEVNGNRNFTERIEANFKEKYKREFGDQMQIGLTSLSVENGQAVIRFVVRGEDHVDGHPTEKGFTLKGFAKDGLDNTREGAPLKIGGAVIKDTEANRDAVKKLFKDSMFNGIFESLVLDQTDVLEDKEKVVLPRLVEYVRETYLDVDKETRRDMRRAAKYAGFKNKIDAEKELDANWDKLMKSNQLTDEEKAELKLKKSNEK